MKDVILHHIRKKKLFSAQHRLLLGVSGGKDSMALAHLLGQAGFSIAVVHCNFQLRGEEANEDERFVKDHFNAQGIDVYSIRFATKKYAEENNCSIQMAARELRYNWFHEVRIQYRFDYIVTAHHANDNVETFFINLLRGSGLNGLKGIPGKTGTVVRPLLEATREEIDEYIALHAIPYREDSSNVEEKYLRNKLRKQLLPLLKEINPSLERTMSREMQFLEQSGYLANEAVKQKLEAISSYSGNTLTIDTSSLRELSYAELLIYEALRPFGFNTDVVMQLHESVLTEQSGKSFFSATHQLLINRAQLIVQPLKKNDPEAMIEIGEGSSGLEHPINVKIHSEAGPVIRKGSHIACIDKAKLSFPLHFTRWREGDSFHPLGMKGSKKLSDFFVDQKMSIFEKQEQWVLRSGNKIVWLPGRRMDERFKVEENTESTLIMEWIR